VIRPASLIQDHAVVQRNRPVRLWGWDNPGQQVRIEVAGCDFETTASCDGRWDFEGSEPPEGVAFDIVIKGSQTHTARNVVAGEVWICSGQSNMTMSLANSANGTEAVRKADCPSLHLYHVPTHVAMEPQQTCRGNWALCSPDSASGFSAVAYYFGRKLHETLGVAVGLIHASWGNSPIHAWMDREALGSNSLFQPILDRWESVLNAHPDARWDLASYHRKWQEEMKEAGPSRAEWLAKATLDKAAGRIPPPEPPRPSGPGDNQSPMNAFNAMIAPLAPWGARGVLWYQGETDAIQARGAAYPALFAAMTDCWRRWWHDPGLYFITAQIANHSDPQTDDASNRWAELRWAQSIASSMNPRTAMIVTTDLGETLNIHPKNKREVGERLCAAALAEVYQQPTPYAGPRVTSISMEAAGISIKFDTELHPQGQLSAASGISIAGSDRTFVPAVAVAKGDCLHVSSPSVSSPGAVRYGWTDDAPSVIRDCHGIPASPFRTDAWPLSTEGNI